MKDQSVSVREATPDKVDKRDLVNIDLYDHEIQVMEDQINQVAEKYKTREMRKKHSHLKKELILQKQELERFRKSCELHQEYLNNENVDTCSQNSWITQGEGFFEHLKAFEENFKNTRNKINDFLSLQIKLD